MALAWIATLIADRTRPSAPAFFIPLLAYAAATLVVSIFSLDPGASFFDSRQLLLFAIVPAVYDIARGERAPLVVDVLVTIGALSAAFGIIQYGVLHYDNLGQRPVGWLTHYMTYSGVLMLVLCAAVARLVFGARDRIWPALVLPALVAALVVTSTRNAWIGASAAVGLLLLLKDLRLAALLPLVLAALFIVAPDSFSDRMSAAFSDRDPGTLDRLAMLEVGGRIVADHPLTGVGPEMVPRVYEQYRPDYAVNASNPHLHNVPMQIAAERGVPALLIWLWFVVAAGIALFRLMRLPGDRVLAATGLAAIVAMLAAGLAEYNFGDSEFLMMFLVLITLPFAAARERNAAEAFR
jgi:O-antigen ligase